MHTFLLARLRLTKIAQKAQDGCDRRRRNIYNGEFPPTIHYKYQFKKVKKRRLRTLNEIQLWVLDQYSYPLVHKQLSSTAVSLAYWLYLARIPLLRVGKQTDVSFVHIGTLDERKAASRVV